MDAIQGEEERGEDAVVSLVKKLEAQVQGLSNRLAELEASREEENTPTPLWKLFTEEGECRDVLERHVLTKLNDTDLKLFHFVSKESRSAIRRAEIEMKDKRFRVQEFSSVSTLEMAWERYPFLEEDTPGDILPTQSHFCRLVASTNNLALLKWVREVKRCRWGFTTPVEAAMAGNLEMLKYCHDRGCDEMTAEYEAICVAAAEGGSLECLRFLHEELHSHLNRHVCKQALKFNHMDCYQYARSRGCPDYNNGVYDSENDSDFQESEYDEDEEQEQEEEDDEEEEEY